MAHKTRPTVLAIDDDLGVCESLPLLLDDHFDVVTVRGGRQALDLLAERRFDVILLDLIMPGMDGEEVLRQLRVAGSQTPVIVLTAVLEVSTVVRCMKLGAADYLEKVRELHQIQVTIERVLREAGATHGVLLVSDHPAALAPLKLALQPHVPVVTQRVAEALVTGFPASVVVLHASERSDFGVLAEVPAHLPGAAVVWSSADPSSCTEGRSVVPPDRLDLTLERIRVALGDSAVPRHRLSPRLLQAIDLMVRHSDDVLTIQGIAERVHVSENHLIREFSDAFGRTAAAYYTRLRIEIACRLLRDTDDKMDQVARHVGYSSAATLSRAFKDAMGVPPGEYRRA